MHGAGGHAALGFGLGDEVAVHYLIKEGDKERVQLFIGTVIALQGRGISRAVVVRRIVQGEGVERTFPLHSPRVKEIERRNPNPRKVRRAKLFYMRERSSKENRLREIHGDTGVDGAVDGAAAATPAPSSSASAAAAPGSSAPGQPVKV
ncbi:MAG: 50S ribosomal protein L19 [Planctomycetota bacterium]|nr:MAG: 50S ribosomal protein L19 [Planctomycetota bacterium]